MSAARELRAQRESALARVRDALEDMLMQIELANPDTPQFIRIEGVIRRLRQQERILEAGLRLRVVK